MLNVFFLGLIWPFVCVSYLAKRLNFFQFVHTLGHYLFKCFFLSSSLLCPFSWPLGTLVTCISGCLIFSHSLLMSHIFFGTFISVSFKMVSIVMSSSSSLISYSALSSLPFILSTVFFHFSHYNFHL